MDEVNECSSCRTSGLESELIVKVDGAGETECLTAIRSRILEITQVIYTGL